jgi:hypothetical protein
MLVWRLFPQWKERTPLSPQGPGCFPRLCPWIRLEEDPHDASQQTKREAAHIRVKITVNGITDRIIAPKHGHDVALLRKFTEKPLPLFIQLNDGDSDLLTLDINVYR